MSYYFSICSSAMYQQKYLEFLLEHYNQLHLPYSFPVALSFIASPILMERESFLCFNEEHEVIGAFGYIYGTGENDYEDTHIIQMQIVFLQEEYHGTTVFLKGLQFLTQYLAQLDQEVTEFHFWAPADAYLRQLFTKIAQKVSSSETAFGTIDEYHASFSAWRTYAAKFRHEASF
ncbi:hypothetical protein [Aneurinibacillus sp. REN35]|uniref:hypothetical protein n=1 Tax=Aneurinibacillus sp. REN35 TaxID=3237286 RepID=UPI0035299312